MRSNGGGAFDQVARPALMLLASWNTRTYCLISCAAWITPSGDGMGEMSDSEVDSSVESKKVSRRGVVAGAIWATPVVMGLTATPALAASAGKATLLQNYHQASPVNGAWVGSESGHYFGGVTGSVGLYIDQTAWNATAITVTSITLKLTVKKSAFGTGAPVVTSSATGVWTAGTTTTSGDDVTYTFTWTGTLKTFGGDRYTTVGFKLPASSSPPILEKMTTAQRTITWTATSSMTTALVGSPALVF